MYRLAQIYDEAKYDLYSLLRLYKIVKDLGMNEHDIHNILELAKYNQLQDLQWKVGCLRYGIDMLECEKSKSRYQIFNLKRMINEFEETLAQKKGGFSVPQGMVTDDFVQQQKSIAERILPTVFGQLVVQTNEPFIQTIYDLSVPRMAFGRVCILGDAAFVPRPHTAAGFFKAATNAVALANSIANSSNVDIVEALKRWEPRQIELGNNLKYLGISLGNRSQFNQN